MGGYKEVSRRDRDGWREAGFYSFVLQLLSFFLCLFSVQSLVTFILFYLYRYYYFYTSKRVILQLKYFRIH